MQNKTTVYKKMKGIFSHRKNMENIKILFLRFCEMVIVTKILMYGNTLIGTLTLKVVVVVLQLE